MGNESGIWIMHGKEWNDPDCVHSAEEALDLIDRIGFFPLFKNDIPGFSLEEYTVPDYWWCGDPAADPWEWREIIARSGKAAYGKFFDNKAGFISKKWLPYFVNYRRDGYDFDALWDDGKAPIRQKKIMDLYMEKNADPEFYSFEIRQKAGFQKGGEKGFEGTLSALQMEMYLCLTDFRQRKNKKGEVYGWPIAVYATPEHIFGADLVSSAYSEEPAVSGKRIREYIKKLYPSASETQITRACGKGVTV